MSKRSLTLLVALLSAGLVVCLVVIVSLAKDKSPITAAKQRETLEKMGFTPPSFCEAAQLSPIVGILEQLQGDPSLAWLAQYQIKKPGVPNEEVAEAEETVFKHVVALSQEGTPLPDEAFEAARVEEEWVNGVDENGQPNCPLPPTTTVASVTAQDDA